ncbi:Gfo/Idh/MocA family oxidoreductase [Streptomyces sp. LP05-1]|uniref:Gfo/Idh/MocA family oxidoreductase n=1 Tax=Streptomyces pyxinae TaxID=2970734 RepID=A0ABT2CQ78_9ACTN|nr:Gfo/Idh/MocA family oxidoreductase [Streptomyces sp. LP05-1]MCS0639583.1 Gfo/Idh/MocA family oxidoreductase [Streptomyces sp. LP05-1]
MTEPTGSATRRPLRIGVLGSADIARRRMLPAFAAADGIEVAAVASREAARAAELANRHGCRPVTGYASLLDLDDVDAVYVPLPAALHATWVEAALLAGKHVLAEKPLTCEPARTRELLELARQRSLALMENVMFVHHPQHRAVRALVTDGAIGELRSFSAAFAVPLPPAGDIRHAPGLGGGALLDIGIYPIRAAAHFLGERLRTVAATLHTGPGGTVETAGAALLRDEHGVSAQLTFGMDHSYRSAYELWGSEGRITLDRAFTPPSGHRPVIHLERHGTTERIELPPADQVALTVEAFEAACRAAAAPDSGPAAPPDARVCLRQADLLDAVRRSAQRRESGRAPRSTADDLTTYAVEGRT